MKLLFSTGEKEYPTNKEIEMDLDNPNLWIAIRTKILFNDWEKIVDDTIEFVIWFTETENEYIIECSNWYDYNYKKSNVYWKPRFYELQSECRHCGKLMPYNERIIQEWRYIWYTNPFNRKWDFCSDKCINKYSEENNFQLIK